MLARVLVTASVPAACNLEVGPRGVEATSQFVEPAPGVSERALPPFESLYVDGPLDVEVRVNEPCTLRFEGDEERLVELSAEVRDGVLLVRADPGAPWRRGPRAVVTLPALTSLTAAGSGWVSVSGLDQARLAVRLRGSGDVRLRGRVGELAAEDGGAGRIDTDALDRRGTP